MLWWSDKNYETLKALNNIFSVKVFTNIIIYSHQVHNSVNICTQKRVGSFSVITSSLAFNTLKNFKNGIKTRVFNY